MVFPNMDEEEDGEVDVYDDEVLEVISLGEDDGTLDENGILQKRHHNLVQYVRHSDVYLRGWTANARVNVA